MNLTPSLLDKKNDVRSRVLQAVEVSIVGPRGGMDEVLLGHPTQEYLAGILFPKETPISREDDEQNYTVIDGGDGDNSFDDPLTINTGIKPSSFGLTFSVDSNASEIIADVEYGSYSSQEVKVGQKSKNGYQRTSHSELFSIPMVDSKKETIPFASKSDFKLQYSVKKHGKKFIVSIFVINDFDHRSQESVPAEACIFQPKIKIHSKQDGEKIFVNTSSDSDNSNKDLEEKIFDLMFRNKQSFSIGHGCSVMWNDKDIENNKVSKLETTFVPKTTLPKIEPMKSDLECLSMEKLFKVKDISEYSELIKPLVQQYRNWIKTELEDKLEQIPDSQKDAALNQIEECKNAVQRIQNGIDIISKDKIAGESFSFANRAMLLQRSYGFWAMENRKNGKVDGTGPKQLSGYWRPFQLVFALANIKSITDPKDEEREIADLLWFPTGGGKTEAYLGIIAFTLAHRRLRIENPKFRKYGTAVLMRYTLRLLTLQQFQRAATLMCACEIIRRIDEKKWGAEPFSVGLWVGLNTTPNSLEGESSAEEAIEKAKQGYKPKEHNPIQLISCPWCGDKLYDESNPYLLKSTYKIGGLPKQLRIFCSNSNCSFYDKGNNDHNIPVLVVDEDIYKRCPSLIIGTVDKFAQIAWKWQTGAIFGRVNKQCEKHGFVLDGITPHCGKHKDYKTKLFSDHGAEFLEPPELIIQDELHLISGPLGTLTGLYETAIDILCTNEDGVKPKIITSTATTRKAREQIKDLFNREQSNIFPPQGFDFGNSFFANEVPLSEDPGKLYVGICSTAKSGLTILGGVSAAILQKTRSLKTNQEENGFTDSDIDPYHTLVSYFNSIRELGGADKMYDDSVPGYIKRIYNNYDKDTKKESFQSAFKEELTSRVDSGNIPKILQSLDVKLGSNQKPVDLLLSTNMLSVGVDISRLGVMIINGQPKNHSEYIQASGRIGRDSPGLIFTIYNYLKPRDLSHYENFHYYHTTFHKNVEPVSLTPFAPRARDKALFGIIVALVRLLEKNMSKDDKAGTFDKKKFDIEKLLKNIRNELAERVDSVDHGERESTLEDFDKLITEWHESAIQYKPLRYRKNPYKREENMNFLLGSVESYYEGLVPIPNSLRDAEQSTLLRYVSSIEEKDV